MKAKLVATEHIYTVGIQRGEDTHEVCAFVRRTGRKYRMHSELRSGPQSFWAALFGSRHLPEDIRKEAEALVLKEWKASKI